MTAALSGVRVVDFSGYASGPVCTMMLGDFGAEVVKIESLTGEGSRGWGVSRSGENHDLSALFAAVNRNKMDISLDLKNPEGLTIAKKLISEADVVVQNMYPGAAERLGIGYEACREINASVIYCNISGFGATGPLSDRPGYDAAMQAYCGISSITGEPDRPSVRFGPSAIDFLTGAHAAYGIVVALVARASTGEGQEVDTSLYQTGLHLMSHWIVDYTNTGTLQRKTGSHFPFLTPSGNFFASDGEFHISANEGRMWAEFCDMLGLAELYDDPRFATNKDRCSHQEALHEFLIPAFAACTVAHWVEESSRRGIVAVPVSTVADVVEHEQATVLDMLVPIDSAGRIRSAGLPINLSGSPAEIRRQPPGLGRDTDEVLTSLGYTPEIIQSLRTSGVVK